MIWTSNGIMVRVMKCLGYSLWHLQCQGYFCYIFWKKYNKEHVPQWIKTYLMVVTDLGICVTRNPIQYLCLLYISVSSCIIIKACESWYCFKVWHYLENNNALISDVWLSKRSLTSTKTNSFIHTCLSH